VLGMPVLARREYLKNFELSAPGLLRIYGAWNGVSPVLPSDSHFLPSVSHSPFCQVSIFSIAS